MGPIVLVDDNEEEFAIFNWSYKKSGLPHEILPFLGGAAFLDFLLELDAEENKFPALVLLDINMPGMNGFEVLANVRNDKRFKKIPPIAMFSNSDDESDMKKAAELGANTYFKKPLGQKEYSAFFSQLKSLIDARH